MLLDLRARVVAGASFTVEAVKAACDDHVGKQEAGMLSTTLRADNDSTLGKLVRSSMKAPLGSVERMEADAQLDSIDKRKSKRTPHDRHQLRMTALYVDVLSENEWNQPAEKVSQSLAHEFLLDAMNDYRPQRYLYMDASSMEVVDVELHDALARWADRPELPQVRPLSYPGT